MTKNTMRRRFEWHSTVHCTRLVCVCLTLCLSFSLYVLCASWQYYLFIVKLVMIVELLLHALDRVRRTKHSTLLAYNNIISSILTFSIFFLYWNTEFECRYVSFYLLRSLTQSLSLAVSITVSFVCFSTLSQIASIILSCASDFLFK